MRELRDSFLCSFLAIGTACLAFPIDSFALSCLHKQSVKTDAVCDNDCGGAPVEGTRWDCQRQQETKTVDLDPVGGILNFVTFGILDTDALAIPIMTSIAKTSCSCSLQPAGSPMSSQWVPVADANAFAGHLASMRKIPDTVPAHFVTSSTCSDGAIQSAVLVVTLEGIDYTIPTDLMNLECPVGTSSAGHLKAEK